MKQSPRTRLWFIPILLLLAGSLGCQPSPGAAPAADAPASDMASQSPSREVDLEFGPGSLDLPDLRVGLSEASGYRSTLTLSFDGTQDGRPMRWSNTYTYAATHAPSASQLLIEETGDDSQPPVFMAEMNGVAYEKRAEELCIGSPIDPANSLAQELEPAAQLPSLFGAEEAGTEAVNGAQAVHYTFDERALAEYGFSKITGELWLASEGGYVLRFKMTTTGAVGYFDENTGGTLSYDYELTEINAPVSIELPADCPPGLVDAPMLPDAANVNNRPGVLEYQTASSVAEARAFYEQQLPKLGWTAPVSDATGIPEGISPEEYQQALEALQALGLSQPAGPTPTPNPDEASIVFHQGQRSLHITITRTGPATTVTIGLRNSAE